MTNDQKQPRAENRLRVTELLLNVSTPIGQGVSVNHYSRVLKVAATNRMIAVD